MRKKLKILKLLLLSVLSVIIIGIASFYILIVWGASEKLQTMWVCTAMTTMNHQYLATWFIPEDKINEILEKNKIDDSEYDSHMRDFLQFGSKEILVKKNLVLEILTKHSHPIAPKGFNTYIAEGYTKLEDGIYLKELSGNTWKGYVMLIEDPLRVKLTDTAYQFEKGQTVKRMVESNDAVAGLNGGGFVDGVNYDSNGGTPAGLLITDGVLLSPQDPESETVYNMIGINSSGVLILRHCTAKWALENDIVSAVSFSPFIVVNGEGTLKNGSGGWGIAPRTAIGQRATGEFLFVAVDGRQIGWSIGCDVDVLQEILLGERAENGAMLDGGSSTVLYYGDDYVNRPSLGHERLINNCFIVTKQ